MVQMRWNRVQTSSEIEIVRVIYFLLLKKNTDIYIVKERKHVSTLIDKAISLFED